jgi:chromosome segregation ATPase
MDYKALYEEQLQKNKDLEARNEIMEQTWIAPEDLEVVHDDYLKAHDELKQENKKLKKENEKLNEQNEDTLASLNFYQECNEELKEEIKKLKQENKELQEELNTSNTALAMVKDENQVNKNNMKKFMEENKKLKEENQYVNDRNSEWTCEVVELREQVDELAEENSAYLDIINELGDYMERIDENAVDVFNDITKDALMVTSRTLE